MDTLVPLNEVSGGFGRTDMLPWLETKYRNPFACIFSLAFTAGTHALAVSFLTETSIRREGLNKLWSTT
jgi:hypothetical protein